MNDARDLTVRLQDLLRRERFALADFLAALSDFHRQRLWLDLGYSSLFYFLHRELGLSKGAAHYRKVAAELLQRFPDLLEPLRDGRLCLTTIVELSNVLTQENREAVLPRFFHASKSEAKQVAVEIRPADVQPRRDVVTRVQADAAPALALAVPASTDLDQPVHPANRTDSEGRPAPVRGLVRPDSIEPLTGDATRVHVTVSRRFLKKLDAARSALSHSHPGAGMEQILEAGLDLLLERHAKRKGLVKKPLPKPRPSSDPDRVPAHVRREVWKRDGGKCQWPLASGGICGSTVRVELDHRIVKARGGPPTVENLRCLCRPHNQLSARQVFGDRWMDRYARDLRGGQGEAGPP